MMKINLSVVDATCDSDNKLVYIKKVQKTSLELSIAQSLMSLPSDPKNHCMPIREIIDPEDANNPSGQKEPEFTGEVYIVMPFLRPVNDPRWETVADIVDFVDQILEVCLFIA